MGKNIKTDHDRATIKQHKKDRKWSDEQRKAQSERLKKSWADKKAREDVQAWNNIGGEVEPWWKKIFHRVFRQRA